LPLLLALVGCACLAPAAAAGAETYGLGDSPGTFARCTVQTDPGRCPMGAIGGYYDDPSFRQLTEAASAHRITQVRLFVKYDAVEEYNGSPTAPGCTLSRVAQQPWADGAGRLHPAGESWNDLQAGLLAAHADGLEPVVSITGYGSPNATPSWVQPIPDTTTLAGWWQYRCGVEGVLNAVNRLPAADRPHLWEAVNEPDSFSIYKGDAGSTDESCAVTPVSEIAGAAKAACAYIAAVQEIHQFAGHAGDTVIAGAFTHPNPAYLKPYAALLVAVLPGALYPPTWAVHDYDDVTASYAEAPSTQLQSFDQSLAADSGAGARDLWVTESGTLLTDHLVAGHCPAAGVDAAGTLGACVNGQTERQVSDAAGFFNLPAAGTAVPITHLFWYQWAGEANWDSGLSDGTGQLRAPWCAFYGAGACTGSPSVSTAQS
jgi:hypothetical protein